MNLQATDTLAELYPDSLLLVLEDAHGQRAVLLTEAQYSVGRAPEATLRIFDRFVSREHATLVREGDYRGRYRYQLNLAKGRNGLFVNGRAVTTCTLYPGDTIGFGPDVKATLETISRLGQDHAAALLAHTSEASEQTLFQTRIL